MNNADLPRSVGKTVRVRVRAHQSRPKDDGKVVRVHARDRRVVHDAVEVEREGAERGVVRVGEAVDDGVKRIPATDDILVLCEVVVLGTSQTTLHETRRRKNGSAYWLPR